MELKQHFASVEGRVYEMYRLQCKSWALNEDTILVAVVWSSGSRIFVKVAKLCAGGRFISLKSIHSFGRKALYSQVVLNFGAQHPAAHPVFVLLQNLMEWSGDLASTHPLDSSKRDCGVCVHITHWTYWLLDRCQWKRDVTTKSLNFQYARLKISVPLAMSTNHPKRNYPNFKK